MRRITVTAAAVALGTICPASADTRIKVSRVDARDVVETTVGPTFGTPTQNARIVRSELRDNKLGIEIAGATKVRSDVELPFTLPPGTHVTAMTLGIGKHAWNGEMFSAGTATTRYHDAVHGRVDPALLEQTWSGESGEHFLLHVFPVTLRDHAIVELTLAGASDDARAIGDFLSLYAGERIPDFVLGCESFAMRYLDKAIIRRYIDFQKPRLAHCYEHALLAHPTLAGTAELHFTILSSGAVSAVSVDGTLEDESVRQCLADDVATWSWSPTDGSTQVNYPISFVPAAH